MAGILNIQINSLMGSIEANLGKIEYYIKKNADKKLDLVVMPEFFATNIDYVNNAEPEDGGETIKFIQELAKKYNTNIIAGSVVREINERLYNTTFAINRQGEVIETYDKVHLFNYMGGSEGERIEAGKDIKIANFDFAKVGMTICFDMRYPTFIREIVRKGAQIIVMPTAWLVQREIYDDEKLLDYAQDMFTAMCRTRAFDNMVYLIVSNQTKECGKSWRAIGNSMIISPTAEVLAEAGLKEGALYAEVEIDAVEYLKSIYPIVSID